MANPFMQAAPVTSAAATLPEYREYAYDFDTHQFVFKDGKPVIVTRNEALKIWIRKALLTERYRYRAYFDDYGVELEQFIGTRANDGQTRDEIYRYIEEGLLVNPYIESIQSISVEQNQKKLSMTVQVTTVYGSLTVGMEV